MTLTVLDVGCSDGFVGAWLRERYQGDLAIDGLELYPQAIDLARGRGYRRVERGLAEDAPSVFAPASYDVVVAYEVLEHVPDVDRFLTALEAMVRPGGLVMLSTPAGTFGTGHNPHHLRCYRAVDLADLARRRGRLADMDVGSDGIATVSYTPEPRLADVAIYTGPSWMTWSPIDIARKGLGGSETAAVRLAEQLSEIGWVVTVYGQVDEMAYRDVIYRSWQTWDPMEPRQAVISSRIPAIFDRPVAARKRILWLHDVDVGDELTPRRAEVIDYVLTLSRWHEQHVGDRYPFLREKIVRTRNGIDLATFGLEFAPGGIVPAPGPVKVRAGEPIG